MNKNQALYLLLGLLAGSLLTFIWLTNASGAGNFGPMRMFGFRQGLDASVSDGLDQHFIEEMIPHHEGAIEMAQLALERSSRSEIRTLSTAIIESQTAEITQMEDWYRQWYGVEVPLNPSAHMGMGRGMMHGGMMGSQTTDIEALSKAENFDEAFLKEMIPHHQMAVMMAQMLLSGSQRPEMVQLGQDIIAAQEAEIEQMQSWLRSW
jgi:uncharacterized protein (DUF305 family)